MHYRDHQNLQETILLCDEPQTYQEENHRPNALLYFQLTDLIKLRTEFFLIRDFWRTDVLQHFLQINA